MIPLGEGMRELSLQNLLKEKLNSYQCGSSLLSMTMNMDEDICTGACRMSHLILERRIVFDERMKNELVFYFGRKNFLVYESGESGTYFITMEPDYLSNLKKSQWKSYDFNSDNEKKNMYDSRSVSSSLQIEVRSDIEWLLQKAAFDENENDMLRAFRVSLERDLNEIRVKLEQLKDCTAFKKRLDYLDGKLSLVSSLSNQEQRQNIHNLVDTLKSQVDEALEKQRKAEGMSSSLTVEDEESSVSNRLVLTGCTVPEQRLTDSHEENLPSEEEGTTLPRALDSSYNHPMDLLQHLPSFSNRASKSLQSSPENQATADGNAVVMNPLSTTSDAPHVNGDDSHVDDGSHLNNIVSHADGDNSHAYSEGRDRRAGLFPRISQPFITDQQSVLLQSEPILPSYVPTFPARKVDVSLSSDQSRVYSSRSTYIPSSFVSPRRPSSSHASSRPSSPPPQPPTRSPPASPTRLPPASPTRSPSPIRLPPSPPASPIPLSSPSIPQPALIPQANSSNPPPNPPPSLSSRSSDRSTKPPIPQPLSASSPPPLPSSSPPPNPFLLPNPLPSPLPNPQPSSTHSDHIISLTTDAPPHQEEPNNTISVQHRAHSNHPNCSTPDESRSSALSSLDRNDKNTLSSNANNYLGNQDSPSPEQHQPIVIPTQVTKQNENQSVLGGAKDKDCDMSHSSEEKNNRREDVRVLRIFHVDFHRYRQ